MSFVIVKLLISSALNLAPKLRITLSLINGNIIKTIFYLWMFISVLFAESFHWFFFSRVAMIRTTTRLCAYDPKNKLFKKHTHVRGFSKWSEMAFFFLRYLFLFQRYSSFPIMQIWSLMTSSVVEVQWCDTKLRISPPIMKQCYWNLAEMLHPTNYTRRFIFWCCYGNMLSSSPFLLEIKYYHL